MDEQVLLSGAMDLLERLGGPARLRRITDSLYDRLLADGELGPVFATTHMPTLRPKLADYLVGACVGEVRVSAERLRIAHAAHQVTDRHFSIMASHLADLLADDGVDPEAAADLLDLIAARRADIVSGSTVATADPLDPL